MELWERCIWDICGMCGRHGGSASAGPSLVEPLSSGRAVEPAAVLLTEPVDVLCKDPGQFAWSSTWEWMLALGIFDNTVTLALDTEDLE